MIALVDADLVAFRCAASAEEEPEEISLVRADKLMRDILAAVDATTYRAFLTGSDNFRKELCPEYKANRKDKQPPKWLQQTREFLVKDWKAEVQDGIEADDALGISQDKELFTTTICSLDKDLLMIPGKHYRWQIGTSKWTKEAEFLEVSYMEGLRSFYTSCLVGDKSDNIRGVDGIGEVKAEKALRDTGDEQGMFDRCRALYNEDARFLRNLKLLWIMRESDDIFNYEKRGLVLNDN